MDKLDIERTIEKRIISGFYPIGRSLKSERVLAEEFECSKTVIHSVFMSLKEKGLIESEARSRNTVSDWVRNANMDVLRVLVESATETQTAELIKGFAEFRIFNEGKCAALAAQNRTEEDLSQLRACLEKLGNPMSREEFSREVSHFHHLIFNATGNLLYAVLFGSFRHLIEEWSYTMMPDWKTYDTSTLENILNAIERHDAVRAECAMTLYTTDAARRLENFR